MYLIQKHLVLDDLHLGDVLIALRNSGYSIDRKSGLFRLDEGLKQQEVGEHYHISRTAVAG